MRQTIARFLAIGAALAALFAAGAAFAQANNTNTWQTPGNNTVGGAVLMGVRPDNTAGVPISVTATFSGADTSSAAATLPAAAGKFTYICGFNVSGLGATGATIVSPTVGTVSPGNTLTFSGGYTFPAGATVAATPFNQTFPGCLAGNAVNTGIAVTVPGAAGNTSTTINVWGFQQ